ncbi:MAG: hypothetical protein J6D34_11920 [Atopobiaceae bacterium]|nr:hypothetical protein [Atopobiaceae bacterium]
MKKHQLIALATTAVLTLSAFPLTGCGQQGDGQQGESQQSESQTTEPAKEEPEPQYADEAFIKDLGKGLEARWELSAAATAFSSAQEEEESLRKCVNAELDILGGYANEPFEDSQLQKKANRYIDLLNDQLEALSYVQKDYAQYLDMWAVALSERTKLIVDFSDNYGLTVSSKYEEIMANMKANASIIAEQEEQQAKVDALFDGTVFEKASDDPSGARYVAVVENNAGFNIQNFGAHVDLLDAGGAVVDTQYFSAAYWDDGEKAEFEIYPSVAEFASTVVTVEYWEQR